MKSTKGIFQRTELLFGPGVMTAIKSKKVLILGLGGVGSWCAESLIRSGVHGLTIVDYDTICTTNINRQLQATTLTVGQEKTEVLKKRLLEINPSANIVAIRKIYNHQTKDLFDLEQYDYIIDAIDSLSNKIELIRRATRTNAMFFSSMGASLRLDPTRIRVTEFWDVKGCPLGAILRKRIRRGELPSKKFLCVYSDEVLESAGSVAIPGNANSQSHPGESTEGEPVQEVNEGGSRKAVINGTVAHITAIFGFTLAGLVLQDIYNKNTISAQL